MAFTRPSLTTIIERIKGDFKSGLSLQAILQKSFLSVFAKAFGGASHTLHGHIEFGIEEKFFPDTGDEETVIRWGTLYDLPRNDATFAQLTIEFTGTTGNTLTLPTTLVRSDGVLYDLDSETVVPASGTVQATVTCQQAGDIGNMDPADELSLQSAVTGVESTAEVINTVVEGEDQESLEDYRTRVLQRLRNPPSGGTVNDYIGYVLQTPGITRAWVIPNGLGAGTVVTYGVEDNEDPIIPDSAKIDEMQETVDALKPVTADHTAAAPVATPLNPTIQLKPNTTVVQNAVIAELEDLLAREAQVAGASDPEQVGLGVTFDGSIKLSQINEAISIAAGEEDHVLDSPTADVVPATGGLATLGTVTFSTLP